VERLGLAFFSRERAFSKLCQTIAALRCRVAQAREASAGLVCGPSVIDRTSFAGRFGHGEAFGRQSLVWGATGAVVPQGVLVFVLLIRERCVRLDILERWRERAFLLDSLRFAGGGACVDGIEWCF